MSPKELAEKIKAKPEGLYNLYQAEVLQIIKAAQAMAAAIQTFESAEKYDNELDDKLYDALDLWNGDAK